ncbi:unnamed protein product [Cuscuta campestris]|uniref:Uncharacterized protein n=1 Tax=Cuscuta campestris TaxID=132261 RepID=A0A484MCC2_9ASTE|nr:unnamed protein product [Cuscuta campestris]
MNLTALQRAQRYPTLDIHSNMQQRNRQMKSHIWVHFHLELFRIHFTQQTQGADSVLETACWISAVVDGSSGWAAESMGWASAVDDESSGCAETVGREDEDCRMGVLCAVGARPPGSNPYVIFII